MKRESSLSCWVLLDFFKFNHISCSLFLKSTLRLNKVVSFSTDLLSETVWFCCLFSFVISSRGLPNVFHSLADISSVEKKFEAAIEAMINFQTERPSVMHTKYDYNKSQGWESRENEIQNPFIEPMAYRDLKTENNEIFSTNVTNMTCLKKTVIFIQKYKYEVWI